MRKKHEAERTERRLKLVGISRAEFSGSRPTMYANAIIVLLTCSRQNKINFDSNTSYGFPSFLLLLPFFGDGGGGKKIPIKMRICL